MTEENSGKNPFVGLIPETTKIESKSPVINSLEQTVNALIENVFLFTLRKELPKGKQLIYMEEIAITSSNSLLNLDDLDQALFERLLLQNASDFLIPNNQRTADTELIAENKVINYLYKSFIRNEQYRYNENNTIITEACNKITELIFRNITTAIKQPDLFEGQSMSQQFLDIFQTTDYQYNDDFDKKALFFKISSQTIFNDDPSTGVGSLKTLFYPIFNELGKKIAISSLVNLDKWIIPFLRCFAQDKSNPKLAEVLLDYITPNPDSFGVKFAETFFGLLLSLSILPKSSNAPYEYYENPIEATSSNITSTLWGYLNTHLDDLHLLFKDFLVLGGNSRELLLNWIGNCLHSNAARGQLWNVHSMQVLGSGKTVSDAFMINLCGVLLRLCKPLLKPQLKVMIVDPTYCGVPEEDRLNKGVHMKGMDKETALVPTEENEIRLTGEKYNFVTECFFMTHKAIDLGYRVCIEKLIRTNRDIHRLQGAYQDTLQQNGADLASNMLQMLTTQMQQFLSLQNTIMEPKTNELVLQFYEATALWLIHVAVTNNDAIGNSSYAPQDVQKINLPLINDIPKTLKSIPEFVIENLINYLTFSRNFETQTIDQYPDVQNSIFTLILIFMGSSERARNPHLRARLAEGLESLLPKQDQSGFQVRTTVKTYLFTRHPHRLEVTSNLLKVFVGIEMTGQSVQFEQKFNYRRPMYAIMDYLWGIDEQKECFKKLAIEAEENINAVDPPIFLRFINLLINDAIFLLDESLSNLQQIRTLQAAQSNGEWDNLPQNEQQQNRANLQHLGMMAKFDNILGRDTIKILKLTTSEIKGIFCQSTMVERVVAMLNYFLLHLVGPKMVNLKVKDKKEFEFDPAHTVREICSIYINLQDSEEFCLAVSQDGRSYSPQLFDYAEQVLVRIGGGQLIGEIKELSIKVQRLEQQQKEDQEALVDAPDEFLDPIMSTLMNDPVTLPSSHVVLDRATIARHLLSDQTDPFNRSSLTMDQVIPNVELREKIQHWMKERRDAYLQRSSSSSRDIVTNE